MLKRLSVIAGALVLTGMLAQSASASLVFDLRLADGTKAKTLTPADIGQPISFRVYAKVQGADAGSIQWLAQAWGSILQSQQSGGASTTAGTWKVVTVAYPGGVAISTTNWNNSGAQAGKIQDLNGDGIMDIGSAGATGDFIAARSKYPSAYGFPFGSSMTAGANRPAPTPSATGDFLLGTAVYTPTGAVGTGTTTFAPSVANGAKAIWLEDTAGVLVEIKDEEDNVTDRFWDPNLAAINSYNQDTGTYLAGTPVVLYGNIPEPASLSLLALGALLGLRRRAA